MAIDMLIRKKWDKFSLDINFKSQSKRIGILGNACIKQAFYRWRIAHQPPAD